MMFISYSKLEIKSLSIWYVLQPESNIVSFFFIQANADKT